MVAAAVVPQMMAILSGCNKKFGSAPLTPLPSPTLQFCRLMGEDVVLRISIHSKLGKAICGVGSLMISDITTAYLFCAESLFVLMQHKQTLVIKRRKRNIKQTVLVKRFRKM
jgi:hypothetical protein